ncbi:MAG TPA: site-specific integrase [Rhodanobacteraceae bacterium]
MKLSKKLSPAIVEGAKPEAEPYRLWDTVVPQLHLRVQPSGVKSWNVQWSRTRSKSLGKWPGVTIDAARTRAKAILIETDEQGAPLSVIDAARPAPDKPITLGDFIRDHFAPWALAHQKAGRATVDALAASFGTIYKRELRSVVAFDIERFKTRRRKAGVTPATINRDLDRIRRVYSCAVEWGFLAEHPLRKVKRLKVDNARVRYLTDAEEQALRDALASREAERRGHRESGNVWCRQRGGKGRPMWSDDGYTDHLMPMVLLAINTGMRRGELFGLEWRSVNLAGRQLTVVPDNAKSGRTRHIPLNNEALDVLTRWHAQGEGKGLVFPSPSGGRFGNINKSWAGIVTAAGLVDFTFHDLRHTFASKLVMAGVDLNTVRELLGHADLKMTLRYAHLAPGKLAAAVDMLVEGK